MDANLEFTALTSDMSGLIESWDLPSASRTLFKQQGISVGSNDQGWVGLLSGVPAAVCTITTSEDGTHSLYFAVKPAQRRAGIGAQLVSFVLQQPAVQNIMHLQAFTDADNTAAQKILKKNGFSQVGYGDDGRLKFERH